MISAFFTFVLLGVMTLACVSLWYGVMESDDDHFYDYDPD